MHIIIIIIIVSCWSYYAKPLTHTCAEFAKPSSSLPEQVRGQGDSKIIMAYLD